MQELCISYSAFSGGKPAEYAVYLRYSGIFHIIAEFLRFYGADKASCHNNDVNSDWKTDLRFSVGEADNPFRPVSVNSIADFFAGGYTEPVVRSAVSSDIYNGIF